MNDALTALGTDGADNIIVTGFIQDAMDTAKRDIVTIKYNGSGQQQWFQVFNGSSDGDDRATAMAVDDNGFICITGLMEVTGSGKNMVTIKYNGNGQQQWAADYNGPANQDDIGFAIAVDNAGNTYVTGTNFTTTYLFHDFVTIKYNSSGDTVWVRRYNGPGNSNDIALDIALDDSANVYVTGYNFTIINHDYATIKYSNNGTEQWVMHYNGSLNGDDGATAIAVDKNQNVYVTGIANSSFGLFYPGFGLYSDIATVKYGQLYSLSSVMIEGEFLPYKFSTDSNRPMIFDRFGNVYTEDEIKRVNHSHNPNLPNDGHYSTSLFDLDFVGNDFGYEISTGNIITPNVDAGNMYNIISQVFNDITTLLQGSDCSVNYFSISYFSFFPAI